MYNINYLKFNTNSHRESCLLEKKKRVFRHISNEKKMEERNSSILNSAKKNETLKTLFYKSGYYLHFKMMEDRMYI
jgi:hypothetical protein